MDAASGQFAVDIWVPGMAETAIVTGDDVTATLEEITFGGETKDYVRLTGEIPLADALEEGPGAVGLRYINRNGDEIYQPYFFSVSVIKPNKVYADYLGTNASGYPVFRVWMYLLNENFTFNDSKFTFKLNDLLGREKFTGSLALEMEDQSGDTFLYKDFAVTLPDDLPKGYYAVSVKYDGRDIYDLDDPEHLLLADYSPLTLIPDRPEIEGWWADENNNMIGVEIGGAEAGATVSAILYDGSDPDNFNAIKTVTLVKDSGAQRNVYYFTGSALQGVNLTKEYQIVFLCDNQIMDIYNNYRINYADITPSENVPAPYVSVTSAFVNNNSITLNIPTWDARITGVRVAESAAALSTAQIRPIAKQIPYTLSEPEGEKTIYIGFNAPRGYDVVPAYRTVQVTLDKTRPEQPAVAAQELFILAGTPVRLAATGLEGGLTAAVQFVDQNNKVLKEVSLIEDPAPVGGQYTYAKNETFTKSILTATKAVFIFTDKAGNKSVATEISVSALAGVDVTAALKYGETTPAGDIGVSLYKVTATGESYSGYAISDAEGKVNFPALAPGDYVMKANSGNAYESLDEDFTVAAPANASEKTLDLGEIFFTSKYPNRATLTVLVKNDNDVAVNNAYVGVGNDQLGVYQTRQTGTDGACLFEGLPYETEGTDYDIYLSSGPYYDYFSQTVDRDTVTKEFQVPAAYSVSGHVYKGSARVSDVYVRATNPANGSTYYGYADNQGEYIIKGLSPGSYHLDLDSYSKYFGETQTVEIVNADVSDVDFAVSTGITLIGKVLKNGAPAYKAGVTLVKEAGEQEEYITGGYATGDGGYVLDGAIKEPGDYVLSISYISDAFGRWQDFASDPVTFTVTDEDLSVPDNRITKDLIYSDPVRPAAAFAGSGNAVASDISVVRNGSKVNLVIKYKNNGTAVVSPTFKVILPAGVSTMEPVDIAVGELAPGAAGQISLPLSIGNTENYFSVPVKVGIGGPGYDDFSLVNFEVSRVTLSGPGAVQAGVEFILYGEATANSRVAIKNAVTGDVLAVAIPNGRWYAAKLSLAEGSYKLAAESADGALSQILNIEAKADQILLRQVYFNSQNATDLPVNSRIGVRAATAWVDPELKGRDIYIGAEFENGSSISKITYHFSSKDYLAVKNGDVWGATLSGWGGAGLKTITATGETTDGRILEFIVVEVTVLVDPSGYVYDKETNSPIEGVKVICEVQNAGSWQKWDGEKYGQVNPQFTDGEGKYGWMVPDGTYRVVAQKTGYLPYVTTEDATIPSIVIPPVRTDVNIGLEPEVRVTGVTLNKTTATIRTGNSEQLTATVAPEDATNAGHLTWISSNESVATVDSTGTVRALMAGTANITAKVGGISSAACLVTVTGTGGGGNDSNTGGGGGGSAERVAKPVASPSEGAVEKGTKVTLTCATADAKIYYTTDGTDPTTASQLYSAPIEITKDTVIKAIGVKSGYENSGILTASYTVKLAGEENAPGVFTDISGYDWAREAILALAEKGIIKGTSDTTFAPGARIKRADYLLLMVRMLGLTAEVKDNFRDVAVNKYYYNEIGIARALGLTTGVGNNNFDPEVSITRQDMFVLACRIMQQQGIITAEANLDVLNQFSDRAEIADYAKNDLAILVSLDLIKGSGGKINPRGNATRAETVVFIYRLAGLLK